MIFTEKHEFSFSDSSIAEMEKWSESYAKEYKDKGYFVKIIPSTTSLKVVATRTLSLGQEEQK